MKIIALNSVKHYKNYAASAVYFDNKDLSPEENLFRVANKTEHNVFLITKRVKEFNKESKKLLSSGIVYIDLATAFNQELFDIVVSKNFILNDQILYIIDYSHHIDHILYTDLFYVEYTFRELPSPWKVINVGYLGELTKRSVGGYSIQQLSTDDVFFVQELLELNDFNHHLTNYLSNLHSHSLEISRISNRVYRDLLVKKYPNQLNIGPRNESIQPFLRGAVIRTFAGSKVYTVSDLSAAPNSKFIETQHSAFDVGQHKNYLNFCAGYFDHLQHYGEPEHILLIGAYPSIWVKDLPAKLRNKLIAYDHLPVEGINSSQNKGLFQEDYIKTLKNNSYLYIDVRTDMDRSKTNWKKRRELVQKETQWLLSLQDSVFSQIAAVTVVLKLTAMDIALPARSVVLHFPVTRIRSEFYLLTNSHTSKSPRIQINQGQIYHHIQHVRTDNVFVTGVFKLSKYKVKKDKQLPVVALYSLSNTLNDFTLPKELLKVINDGVITVRLRNNFKNEVVVTDGIYKDHTFLKTDFSDLDIISTGFEGAMGWLDASMTYVGKHSGNVHMHLIKHNVKRDLDDYAAHYSISKFSHMKRFIESASSQSAYILRNLPIDLLKDEQAKLPNALNKTPQENQASGHLYNAIVYFRQLYNYDIIFWLKAQISKNVKNEVQHSKLELTNACYAALRFALQQNDYTCAEYSNVLRKFIGE